MLFGSFNPRAHAGRDLFNISIIKTSRGFNPRAHAGRDSLVFCSTLFHLVSIHAPTRGATHKNTMEMGTASVSIHAPTRGATRIRIIPVQSLSFNPRAHAGRDVWQLDLLPPVSCFNPRAHAGRDYHDFKQDLSPYPVSIHAPTRGATPDIPLRTRCKGVSIHAPTRGAT